MYFVQETAAAVVDRIQRALAPGGYLFLGHAETLRGLSQAFHLRRDSGTFYYQLREGNEPLHPAVAIPRRESPPFEAAPQFALAGGAAAGPTGVGENGRASPPLWAPPAAPPQPNPTLP